MRKISREERERRASRMIAAAGGEGILQVEVWKALGVCSREVSRMVFKFLERGFIERVKELYEGRWTYRLFFTKKRVNIDSIMDCPCMACYDIDRCSTVSRVSPILCKKLTYWINLKTDTGHVSPDEFHEDDLRTGILHLP